MTPPLARRNTIAMRHRNLRRKRAERVLTVIFHAAAVIGFLFIAGLILGLLP